MEKCREKAQDFPDRSGMNIVLTSRQMIIRRSKSEGSVFALESSPLL